MRFNEMTSYDQRTTFKRTIKYPFAFFAGFFVVIGLPFYLLNTLSAVLVMLFLLFFGLKAQREDYGKRLFIIDSCLLITTYIGVYILYSFFLIDLYAPFLTDSMTYGTNVFSSFFLTAHIWQLILIFQHKQNPNGAKWKYPFFLKI
ncbi:hypothetical protein [Marinilactibacillus kalidii]|uniref:hypothetical protein n=1 Tax=Marinilactibacillus kalidii TaxID=2820274 RepID=UPI001ABE2877|nr:hypothetical protein [Marinilactibacillus kalidii]